MKIFYMETFPQSLRMETEKSKPFFLLSTCNFQCETVYNFFAEFRDDLYDLRGTYVDKKIGY